MTTIDQRIEKLQSDLESLMEDYPEFRIFISFFHIDGSISWTKTESLCLACVIDYMVEIKEKQNIKHFDELVH